MIPLTYARICADLRCTLIFDSRVQRTCPQCGFSLTVPVSKWLNREPVERVQGHCRVP